MFYDFIHTDTDCLKEDYLYGCDLTDQGYPRLPRAVGTVQYITNAVPLHHARQEIDPKHSICHMFLDDSKILSLWNQPYKMLETLRNYRYVCAPDFSSWETMPMPLRQYNKYRNHALAWYLLTEGINVIPTAMWNDKESFEWCFDGMPKHSIIAVSSNGCMSKESQVYFKQGFYKMIEVLEPTEIVWVGSKINVDCNVPIYYYESEGQKRNRKGKKNGK